MNDELLNSGYEELNKALLMMNYDFKKTLDENKTSNTGLLITEQIKDDKVFLQKAYDAGCFQANLRKVKQEGGQRVPGEKGGDIVPWNYEGKPTTAFYGFNTPKDQSTRASFLFFIRTPKQVVVKYSWDENQGKYVKKIERPWSCEKIEKVTSLAPTLDVSNMTADQNDNINFLLNYPQGKTEKLYISGLPQGVDYRSGDYEKVDVSTIKDVKGFNSSLFSPNEYFVYKKSQTSPSPSSTEAEKQKANLDDIETTFLNPQGYTSVAPSSLGDKRYSQKIKLSRLGQRGYDIVNLLGFDPDIYPMDLSKTIEDTSKKTVAQKLSGPGSEPKDKKGCKKYIQLLHNFLQNPNSDQALEYSKNPKSLLDLKNYVEWCKNNLSDIKKDLVGNIYNQVSTRNKFGMADFSNTQFESTKKLQKVIRENLIRTEQKNKKILKEEKIISTRMSILAENYKSIHKKPTDKFFDEVISEMIYLNGANFNQQLIQEQFGEFFKNLFGHKMSTIGQLIMEYMATWLVNKLGLDPKSWAGSMITVAVGNLPFSKMSTLLTCEGLSSYLSKSVMEGTIKKLQNWAGVDSIFMDGLRNALMEALRDNETFKKNIEGAIGGIVCPLLPKLSSKFSNAEEKLKDAALKTS